MEMAGRPLLRYVRQALSCGSCGHQIHGAQTTRKHPIPRCIATRRPSVLFLSQSPRFDGQNLFIASAIFVSSAIRVFRFVGALSACLQNFPKHHDGKMRQAVKIAMERADAAVNTQASLVRPAFVRYPCCMILHHMQSTAFRRERRVQSRYSCVPSR